MTSPWKFRQRRRTDPRAAARLCVETLEDRLVPAAFSFDPDGPGPLPAQNLASFDFEAGNALADNALSLNVGDSFQLLFQTRLSGFVGAGGSPLVPAGLNTSFEITVVASLTETVTSLAPGGAPATFEMAAIQASSSFVQLWYDDSPDANQLAGTGFHDGVQILGSIPDRRGSFAGSFTPQTDTGGSLLFVPYDQFGTDDYPAVTSASGTGTLDFGGTVQAIRTDFFRATNATFIQFSAAMSLPFAQANPSAAFHDGTAVPVAAAIGTINGSTTGGGNDVQVQVDADASVLFGGIRVVKRTNGIDSNTPPGLRLQPGTMVTYTYTVTNTGEVPLSGVQVVDDNGTPLPTADDFVATFVGGDVNSNGLLDLTETFTFQAIRIVGVGPQRSVATATGSPAGGGLPVTEYDTESIVGILPLFAVGTDAGVPSLVQVYHVNGARRLALRPFGSFTGGVRVATGDVNGDGVSDIIVGAGPGPLGGHVMVFSGVQGAVLHSFYAYPGFGGGVFVAAGDVNGDGRADIVTGTGPGATHVKVFSGSNRALLANFLAYGGYTGGVHVGAGDVDHDGRADILTGAGAGAPGGHVKAFSGRTGALLASYLAFGSAYTGGVFVAGGDVDGDLRADILAAPAGPGAGGTVQIYSVAARREVERFAAYPGFSGGVRVATADIDGDGLADLLTVPGRGLGAHVRIRNGLTLAEINRFFALDPLFTLGAYIG